MNPSPRVLSLVVLQCALGCSSGPVIGVDRDAEPDAGTSPDAGSSPDAGNNPDASAARDGGVQLDASDDSLRGTTLEGVRIDWPDTLELCSRWREGLSIDAELANKAHVSLKPALRPSLAQAALTGLHLGGGLVRRSPFADRIQDLSVLDPVGILSHYELTNPSGDTSLEANIEYEIADLGILVEQLNVTRVRGMPAAPVIAGDDNFEHHFYLYTPGAHDGTPLERCGGPATLGPSVQVLVGSNAGHSFTITRFLRTREAFAGSFPVNLSSVSVHDSAQLDQRTTAFGYWSQTYAAAHHNWNEGSVIDFTRDLRLYHSVIEPYRSRGVQSIASLVTGVQLSPDSGTLSNFAVDTLTLATGNTVREAFQVSRGWAEVGTPILERQFRQRCAAGRVITVRDEALGNAFQLLTCPRSAAPGFSLEGLVPVGFDAVPEAVGLEIPASAITEHTVDARPAFSMAISGYTLTIGVGALDQYFVYVRDPQGQTRQPFVFAGPLEEDPQDETLKFHTADQAVSVEVVRRRAGQGVGESTIYAPVRFALRFGGVLHEVEAWDRLAYTNSHHNWADVLVAKGGGLTMSWSVRFENGPLLYRVRAVRDADGVEVLPPTDVAE